MKTLFSLLLLALAALAPQARAKIWVVAKDGSGDFSEIQPAVDAAAEGDVIVVREGEYRGALIGKPITIVGAGIGRTMVDNAPGEIEPILVYRLPQGNVMLASFTAQHGAYGIDVDDSQGTVVADDVFVAADYSLCAAHSFDRLFLQRIVQGGGQGYGNGSGELRCDQGQLVSVTQSSFVGLNGQSAALADALPGDHGLLMLNGGRLYLANVSLTGGLGGFGSILEPACFEFYAARGGDGLHFEGVEALIAGSATDVFQGGGGGDGWTSGYCGFTGRGGDGGDGLNTPFGMISYAAGTPLGGKGGSGSPPGKDGLPTRGSVFSIPPLPTCRIAGDAALGKTFTFSYTGTVGDQLVVLFSGALGKLNVPGTEGFPLFTVPGSFFFAVPLGTIGPGGVRDLPLTIPNNPDYRGSAVFTQGVLMSATGAHKPQLTNVTYAIVKEP